MLYNQEHMKRRLRSLVRKWWVWLIIVVLLAGGIGGYFYITQSQKSRQNTEENAAPAKAPISDEVVSVQAQATATLMNDGFEAAVGEYDQAIENAIDSRDVGELTQYKAVLYLNQGSFDDALRIAEEAEQIAPTRFTAGLIAEIYLAKGNKDQARIYLTKALERVSTDGFEGATLNDKNYYETRLKQVQ